MPCFVQSRYVLSLNIVFPLTVYSANAAQLSQVLETVLNGCNDDTHSQVCKHLCVFFKFNNAAQGYPAVLFWDIQAARFALDPRRCPAATTRSSAITGCAGHVHFVCDGENYASFV
jgi:hypothetical protein